MATNYVAYGTMHSMQLTWSLTMFVGSSRTGLVQWRVVLGAGTQYEFCVWIRQHRETEGSDWSAGQRGFHSRTEPRTLTELEDKISPPSAGDEAVSQKHHKH